MATPNARGAGETSSVACVVHPPGPLIPMKTATSRGDSDQTGDDPVLECESMTREYVRNDSRSRLLPWRSTTTAPTVTAVADVSLSVRAGELVGLSGPSGSGKSTLLHLLAGLDTPTSGTVELCGTETGPLSESERARLRLDHVGIVFQRFHLLPSLSARANVALPLIEGGLGKRARRDRATALLDRVGLADRETHKPGELSGGEQQRVAIARALATDPPVLVADEPTGELDTETGERILDLFTDLGSNRAVVLASHDERALGVADRLIRLRDGRVVSDE